MADHRLSLLVGGLERARSRIRERLLLKGALVALAAAASSVVVLRVAYLAVPGARAAGVGDLTAAVAAAVLAAALLLVLVGVRRFTPGVVELARRADRRYELQERLSTAIELTRPDVARSSTSSISELMIADACAHADRVRPASLVDVPVGRQVVALAALALIAAAAELAPLPTVGTGSRPTASTPAAAAGTTTVTTVSDVRQAAALVARDAATRHDPYLKALAGALQDLGTQMQAGQLDNPQIARELSLLEVQLERAYGVGKLANAVNLSLQPAAAHGAAGHLPSTKLHATAKAAGSAGPKPVAGAHARAAAGKPSPLSNLVRQLEAGAPRGASKRSAAPRQLPALGSQPGAAGSTSSAYFRSNARQVALAARTQALLDANGQPAGQPVGPARHATQGPGDQAGHGSQPVTSGTPSPAAKGAGAAGGNQLVLPGKEIAGGARIELQLAPATKLAQVGDRASGRAAGAGRGGIPAIPRGALLDAQQRAAVTQYFLPASPPATGGPQAPSGGQ